MSSRKNTKYRNFNCIYFSIIVPHCSNIRVTFYKGNHYLQLVYGGHQCGFRHNRSTTDQIFCIRQILEKKWEYNGAVRQLFIDFSKAYDSVRREVLYKILIEFGIPRKLVRLIKMC
jgi:hypothetical protein